ncbi:hypothetical protein AFIC_000492 [[Pseudomonas] carboxydohydrogena]|uniref:Competence protein CoiA nuclease-like domain-containing protein n=1 Tax=Afipia carboxydohydrogena TaxID=290 RepID=A0ABY8BUF4_AFICR|nr:hypothetical protein [[Pseudomonas] carboxydohydrogena]WEF52032.1 hypothetical protein AFIC_000492 [[Pseudomonas] carboxydohydrogena]
MPLKAKLDGREIVSVLCSDRDWSEAQHASKGTENRLRMSCCDAPAYASHSPLDLRYFAHKSGYDRCPSGGESDEHESLKAAAARTVQSLAGWQADVEVSGDGWRADVLAMRGSIKIAIEVQLSAQAKRQTGARNDRFEASEVSAFWLKGPKNRFNDFGDGLQGPVHGASIREQMASVGVAVRNLIGAVERQVRMANELARLIRTIPGWKYDIDLQGTIPACFELQREAKRQQILLGELGPSLLPTIFRPVDGKQIGADQFAGAILQLRVNAPHLRGYQASSFQLASEDLANSLARQLRPILEGKKTWQGKEHTEVVPGAFVHYPEQCPGCETRFLRITHLLIGHPRRPRTLPVKVVRDEWRWYEPILSKAELLSRKVGLPLGPLVDHGESAYFQPKRVDQRCPVCGKQAPDPLISNDEALRAWPGRDEHFRYRLPAPGKGWSASTRWVMQLAPDAAVWDALLDAKRAERQKEREEERRREDLAEAERNRRYEELKRQAEERRQQRIADDLVRKAVDEQRAIEARRQAEEDRQARIVAQQEERKDKLRTAAETAIRDRLRRNLWLTTGNSHLRLAGDAVAPRPIEVAAQSKEGLEMALQLLRSTKF